MEIIFPLSYQTHIIPHDTEYDRCRHQQFMICKLEIQSSPSQVNISIAVLQAPAFLVFDGKEIKMGDLQGKYHMTGCHNQSLLN